MTAQITIREAIAGDSSDVAAVFDAAFAPLRSVYRPKEEAAARQAERADEGTRLVAIVDGRIVGTVQFDDHSRHVHVLGLAVHPEFQRRGIARSLIEEIARRTPSLGHDTVRLDTIRETGNVSVFEGLGFRVVGVAQATWCESDHFPVVHEVTMERECP